jgi:hypothetical protein
MEHGVVEENLAKQIEDKNRLIRGLQEVEKR